MTTYTPWTKALSTPSYDLTWQEAEAFLKEFRRRAPERVAMLQSYVSSTSGFQHWRADCSERSFRDLGPWLLQVLKRRMLKRSEKGFTPLNPALSQETVEYLDRWFKQREEWTYLPESEAVLLDVGIYLGECLRKRHPTTRWIRCKAKKDFNFNYPLLGVSTNTGMNPFDMPSGVTRRIIEKEVGADEFWARYQEWSHIAAVTEPRRAKWKPKERY